MESEQYNTCISACGLWGFENEPDDLKEAEVQKEMQIRDRARPLLKISSDICFWQKTKRMKNITNTKTKSKLKSDVFNNKNWNDSGNLLKEKK